MKSIEDPIWVGRPNIGNMFVPLILALLISTIGVLIGLVVLYKLIYSGEINMSIILLIEIMGVFLYSLFQFYRYFSILHYILRVRYAMFSDRILIEEKGLFSMTTTIRFEAIDSMSRVEHGSTNNDTIYFHTNKDTKHRSFDLDALSRRTTPTFERILDGDFVLARLDDLHLKLELSEAQVGFESNQLPRQRIWSRYANFMRYFYWAAMLVSSTIIIDTLILPPTIIDDVVVRRDVILNGESTETKSLYITESSRSFLAYPSITSPGGLVQVHESKIWHFILDVKTKAGSRKHLLLTGLNGLTGMIFVFTFIAVFYAFIRLHNVRNEIKSDEIGILFIGPVLLIIVSIGFFSAFN